MHKPVKIFSIALMLATFGGLTWYALRPGDPYAGAGDPGTKEGSAASFLEIVPTSAGAINNPLNIKKSPTVFQGEIDYPGSKDFTSFIDCAHCYRAGIEILRHYYNIGFTTLAQMISRYAPAKDHNDPGAYANYISEQTGIDVNSDLHGVLYSSMIQGVIKAMTRIEQGAYFAINDSQIQTGYLLA